MRFHWQDLNDAKIPRWGGGRRHGRAWLTLFERDEAPRRSGISVNWEWCLFWDASCGASLAFRRQDGHGVGMHLALPWLFSIYVTLLGGPFAWLARAVLPKYAKEQPKRPRWEGDVLPVKDYGDRELFNIYWHDWGLWWFFWRDPMGGWSSRSPWWRRKVLEGHVNVVDLVFGRPEYEARAIDGPVAVKIPMPERAYDATVTIEERIWRRKRWPFVWRRWIGADIDCKSDPVGFPGKGENSWDCGEDATYGMSCSCPTGRISDAIGHFVASKLHDRKRHGGSYTWAPREDHRPKPKSDGGNQPETADCAAS